MSASREGSSCWLCFVLIRRIRAFPEQCWLSKHWALGQLSPACWGCLCTLDLGRNCLGPIATEGADDRQHAAHFIAFYHSHQIWLWTLVPDIIEPDGRNMSLIQRVSYIQFIDALADSLIVEWKTLRRLRFLCVRSTGTVQNWIVANVGVSRLQMTSICETNSHWDHSQLSFLHSFITCLNCNNSFCRSCEYVIRHSRVKSFRVRCFGQYNSISQNGFWAFDRLCQAIFVIHNSISIHQWGNVYVYEIGSLQTVLSGFIRKSRQIERMNFLTVLSLTSSQSQCHRLSRLRRLLLFQDDVTLSVAISFRK
jgi:hypothetical protein